MLVKTNLTKLTSLTQPLPVLGSLFQKSNVLHATSYCSCSMLLKEKVICYTTSYITFSLLRELT